MSNTKRKSGKTPPRKRDSSPKPGESKTAKGGSRAHGSVKKGWYIAGMGASAGGLEAFEEFFRHMPPVSGVSFVVVSHLEPHHVSMLPDLLQKHTKMKVSQVKNGMKAQPDHVYIIPPNKDMRIAHGKLLLLRPAATSGPRLPIDYFFRSLAEDQGEKAICIILSGMGTDGTAGLRAVKGGLGMAMAQDPSTAKYDSMPKNAVGTGLVDYVLPPSRMPEQLIAYVGNTTRRPVMDAVFHNVPTPDELQRIFAVLRASSGHDFSTYKKSTILRRITRRAAVHHVETFGDYIRYLQQNQQEAETLFSELLIGVTSFFREPEAFESLKKSVLQELLRTKSADKPIRVWVPGCSSGEEAYSIAVLLRETMDETGREAEVQIFATDIDKKAIDTARTGVYPAKVAQDIGKDRLDKFFIKENETFRVTKPVREMVVFSNQNLVKDPPFTKLDLISCRNLLIYLDPFVQNKLFPIFHYSLKPDGALFLGSSETIGGFIDLFSFVDKKWKIFKRRVSLESNRPILDFPYTSSEHAETGFKSSIQKKPAISNQVENFLLEHYVAPCVIINEKGSVVYIHGRTGKYLEPSPGNADWNIMTMAREGLKTHLPMAVYRASSQKKEVLLEGLQVKTNGGFECIDVRVRPFGESKSMAGFLIVLFESAKPAVPAEPAKITRSASKKNDTRVVELEKELKHTKENLQALIEELESSNEELKLINEEYQSTNEELQSANEELNTSKEELQSLNEELETVNAEFVSQIDELTKTNNDLKNLLDAAEIPIIFLDGNLTVTRYTALATKVINLIPSDIGRPITDFAQKLKYENLLRDAEEVLQTLVPKELETQTKDGRWYLIRIRPYRTVDNVIDGLVLTFVDITEQKLTESRLLHANNQLEEARAFTENIVETVKESILVLDQELRVETANRSFCQTFQVTKETTVGQYIYNLGNGQWDIPRLRELLEKIIPTKSSFDGLIVEHVFPEIGFKKMMVNARSVYSKNKNIKQIFLAVEDVTEKE